MQRRDNSFACCSGAARSFFALIRHGSGYETLKAFNCSLTRESVFGKTLQRSLQPGAGHQGLDQGTAKEPSSSTKRGSKKSPRNRRQRGTLSGGLRPVTRRSNFDNAPTDHGAACCARQVIGSTGTRCHSGQRANRMATFIPQARLGPCPGPLNFLCSGIGQRETSRQMKVGRQGQRRCARES